MVVTFLPAAPFVEKDTTVSQPGRVQATVQADVQVTVQAAERLIGFATEPRTTAELQAVLGLRHRATFQTNYLRPLIQAGYLAMTLPDKPRSPLQRYVATDKGRAWLIALFDESPQQTGPI